MTFDGFPVQAIRFYEGLAADNSKSFWQANRPIYLDAVKAPFDALAAELADFGPFHLFRPYNDVRFAKGRPPYKTHQGMYAEREGGAGYYVHLEATELMVGCGYYSMAPDQLERFRQAVVDDHRGTEVAALATSLDADGWSMEAMSSLKTAPRGYPKDHLRIEFLRRKGLVAMRKWPIQAWMHTPAAAGRISAAWRACDPLNEWLDAHVGPSELPPPDFDR